MKNNVKMIDPRRVRIAFVITVIFTIAAIIAALTLPYYVGRNQLRKEHPYLDLASVLELSRDGDTFYAPYRGENGHQWALPCNPGTSWLELADQEGKDSEVGKVASLYRKMLPGTRKDAVKAYAEEYFCGTRYTGKDRGAVEAQLYKTLLH